MAFTLSLAISTGANTIAISGTDPAGNVSQVALNVQRGTGKLAVTLTTSAAQIKRSKLAERITLSAIVTDPDGRPVPDAAVTFQLGIPGIGPITAQGTTSETGAATFTTNIPKGADLGSGQATVLVSSTEFGDVSDFKPLAIVK